MSFLQLTFDVGSADPGPFEDALLDLGAMSITLQDAADDPVLEPAPGATPLWPSVRIRALFDAQTDTDAVIESLRMRWATSLPDIAVEILADRVWEREWLKDFRPMRFGKRLWVCPAGQLPPECAQGYENPSSRCLIDLDPGLAFGTGTHPTTALCLEWLDQAAVLGKTVIDYGCGSGILAIAALKLGAKAALAVDIDPQALSATQCNAERNGVAQRLTVCEAQQLHPASADILLANILAEPLQSLAASLATLVVPQGKLVLSGLLVQQAQRVTMHYTPWFDMAPASALDGWARLDGVRRTAHP